MTTETLRISTTPALAQAADRLGIHEARGIYCPYPEAGCSGCHDHPGAAEAILAEARASITEADERLARVARERANAYAQGVEDGIREANSDRRFSLDCWGFARAYADAYRDYYAGVRTWAPSLVEALALWRSEQRVV